MHSFRIKDLPSQHQIIEKKIQRAEPLPENLREGALKALRKLPQDDLLCHGDFHPDNIQMSKRGPVIIDWSDATKGTPVADIARTKLLITQSQPVYWVKFDPKELSYFRTKFMEIYLSQYSQLRSFSNEELELWQLPVAAARLSEGIKGEEEGQLLSIVETSLNRLE
jgi:Ser/Thr protein kinase RdoA (MazF antagonist)